MGPKPPREIPARRTGRKRIIRFRPVDFLAPSSWLIAGLPLEAAMGYFQHLCGVGQSRPGVWDVMSARGTCRNSYEVDPIGLETDRPALAFKRALQDRFRHILLGPSGPEVPAWREEVRLGPDDFFKTQRVPIRWRGDRSSQDCEDRLDRLAAHRGTRFRKPPSCFNRYAVWIKQIQVGVDPYGFFARISYGYRRDSTRWEISYYSHHGDTFTEFLDRVLVEMERDKQVGRHPCLSDRIDSYLTKWDYHVGKIPPRRNQKEPNLRTKP